MLLNLAKISVFAALISGLCTPAQANTTVAPAFMGGSSAPVTVAQAQPANSLPKLAQNDIALPPVETYSVTPPEITDAQPGAPLGAQNGAPFVARGLPVRIALLLPLRSPTLGAAADAVRAGVQAAYEREKDGVSVNVIETDGSVQGAVTGYTDAATNYDMVIGPLSRSEVTAIAQGGSQLVTKPTIALAQSEITADAGMVLPPQMLTVGLSIEEEARQVANLANADKTNDKAFIISTSVTWQRRAAKAFTMQWQQLGGQSQLIELGLSDGYLSASNLVQLKKRMQSESPSVLFVALDAGQAAQLRLAIGGEIPIYGTSQLNPLALADWQTSERVNDMNGTRLLDIPWQLQADHPAVMVYPRLVLNNEQQRSADLSRLYALGIDAYRIAREIAMNHTEFELDGVTGKLAVRFGTGPTRFRRIEQPAIYQDGTVMPIASTP